MASQRFDLTVKLYNFNELDRTYYSIDFKDVGGVAVYPDIIFPFSQNQKLKQVRCNATFRYAGSNLMLNIPPSTIFEFKWVLWGLFLNTDGSPILNNRCEFLPEEEDALIFNVASPRMLIDSDNSVFEPDCLYCGGLRLEEMLLNWRSLLRVSGYFARVRLSFEFEV